MAASELENLARLIARNQLTLVEQLHLAPELSEWVGCENLRDEQVRAYEAALRLMREQAAKRKRPPAPSAAGAARKKPCTGPGLPRAELSRLEGQLLKGSFSAIEWVEKTRVDQIVGRSATTRASLRSGLRFWEAYVKALRPGEAFLPPRLDELIAWTALFRRVAR